MVLENWLDMIQQAWYINKQIKNTGDDGCDC